VNKPHVGHAGMTCTADIDVDVAAMPFSVVLHKLTSVDWKSVLCGVSAASLDELLVRVGYLEESWAP